MKNVRFTKRIVNFNFCCRSNLLPMGRCRMSYADGYEAGESEVISLKVGGRGLYNRIIGNGIKSKRWRLIG